MTLHTACTLVRLNLIAADPNVASAFKRAIAAPQWFRPLHGRWGRAFLSQADSDAYDRGWCDYPDTPSLGLISGPAWSGYHDRDADQMARDEALMEAAQEARERDE
jgi:hypothetical protein